MSDAAKIAGVIGWPVSHSLSPKLHNYWLEKYNIPGEYRALAVAPEKLRDFLAQLPGSGWRGCNITLPHKEEALRLLEAADFNAHIDDAAREIKAINTIIVEDAAGRALRAGNTDAYGFAENIRSHITGKKKAVVLGAGGAASAVWAAIRKEGFQTLVVTNRTEEKLSKLKGNWYVTERWDDRSAILKDADLLVNATSLGMAGKEPLEMDLSLLPRHALVTDIVYTPLMTPLLKQAKARGNPVADGLGMLLHQAVPGFEAWFGRRPEVTAELREYMLS